MAPPTIKANDEYIPSVLKIWIYLYNLVPPVIKIPFTDVSMSFSLCCAVYLSCWRVCIIRVLITLLGWPDDNEETVRVSENLSAIVHSMTLCPILLVLLLTQPYDVVSVMKSHPRWWQDSANAMLELCTGYMIYDASVSFLYKNYDASSHAVHLTSSDWCFLGHHFATSVYMTSARINGAGHMSAMIIMFLGELSNPFQNTMLSVERAIQLGECCASMYTRETLYPYVRFAYASVYSVLRILLGPLAMLDISYRLLLTKEGRTNVPVSLTLLWLTALWGVTIGSLPWCYEAVDIVTTFLTTDSTTSTAAEL